MWAGPNESHITCGCVLLGQHVWVGAWVLRGHTSDASGSCWVICLCVSVHGMTRKGMRLSTHFEAECRERIHFASRRQTRLGQDRDLDAEKAQDGGQSEGEEEAAADVPHDLLGEIAGHKGPGDDSEGRGNAVSGDGAQRHGEGVLRETQADGGQEGLVSKLRSKDQREGGQQEGPRLAIAEL